MAIRMPHLANAKKILRRSTVTENKAGNVRKGHFVVYVGESEKKRFVVPISFLSQPSFQQLLSQAEEEFGFNHPNGGLSIPCGEDIFVDLTAQLGGLLWFMT